MIKKIKILTSWVVPSIKLTIRDYDNDGNVENRKIELRGNKLIHFQSKMNPSVEYTFQKTSGYASLDCDAAIIIWGYDKRNDFSYEELKKICLGVPYEFIEDYTSEYKSGKFDITTQLELLNDRYFDIIELKADSSTAK